MDWFWRCGFYPGSGPGRNHHRQRPTFDAARVAFEAEWAFFVARRSEADFQEWREARDKREQKYAMWARGEKLPTQLPIR